MPKPKRSPGPTRARQFRLTDAELATIDRLAKAISPESPITRTAVVRVALRVLASKLLPAPSAIVDPGAPLGAPNPPGRGETGRKRGRNRPEGSPQVL